MSNLFLRLTLHSAIGVIHHFAVGIFHHLFASSEIVFKVKRDAPIFQLALFELGVLLGLFL